MFVENTAKFAVYKNFIYIYIYKNDIMSYKQLIILAFFLSGSAKRLQNNGCPVKSNCKKCLVLSPWWQWTKVNIFSSLVSFSPSLSIFLIDWLINQETEI